MNKVEAVTTAMGLVTWDSAIPHLWAEFIREKTRQEPFGHFVWCYDGGSIFGYPVAIDFEGARILDAITQKD